jgi:hypothetical protein
MFIGKIVSLAVAFATFSNVAFADCAFNDLKHNADGTVTYSAQDHVCVGNLVQDDATKTKQVQDLNKAITLKDLAITKSDARAQLWQDTSLKLESNIQSIDSYKSTSNWMFFGLGVLTIVGAGMLPHKYPTSVVRQHLRHPQIAS